MVRMMSVLSTSKAVKGTRELTTVLSHEYARANVDLECTARHVDGLARPAVVISGTLQKKKKNVC